MSPPKYPGTGIEMPRKPQPSEPEDTPRNEIVLQVAREAEERRKAEWNGVHLRLVRVETAVDKFEALANRMDRHLTDAKQLEEAREKRNRRLRRVATAVALPVILAIVGSGAAAWTQLLIQARSQAKIGGAQVVASAVPSMDDTILAAEKRGQEKEYARQQQWLADHPLPIFPQTSVIAARGKGR